MCGKNKLKPNITEELLALIKENQVESNDESGLCTTVVISDRFALTAAHCWQKFESE